MTTAFCLTFLARAPKRSVETVSAALYELEEQATRSTVKPLPPSEGCSSRVSLESR